VTDEPSEKTARKEAGDAEFIIILASGAIQWVNDCPLPLWEDKDGHTHYLRGVNVSDGAGKQHFCFFERPMAEFEALAEAQRRRT
jgi:hypothetical protein